MAEHEPGSMDIAEQHKTFEGFLKTVVVVAVISLIVLIVLAAFRT